MSDNLDHHAAHDAASWLQKQLNLARCYLDLRAQLARAEAERDTLWRALEREVPVLEAAVQSEIAMRSVRALRELLRHREQLAATEGSAIDGE